MKIANLLTLITVSLFFCSANRSAARDYLNPDSVKLFIVDDYPITNDMLRGAYHSLGNTWFTNHELNQGLVFELYTDLHRMVTFHFYNNDVPAELVGRMIRTKAGETTTLSRKMNKLNSIVNSASSVDKKYFTTNKGLILGDGKEKVLRLYGNPNTSVIYDSLEVLEWIFVGDTLAGEEATNDKDRLARNSFGHQAKMLFRNDVLIAVILHNDIP